MAFANSLDPDQTRQNVGLIWIHLFHFRVQGDQTHFWFGTRLVFMKEFFEKVDFEKKTQMTKKACKITQ